MGVTIFFLTQNPTSHSLSPEIKGEIHNVISFHLSPTNIRELLAMAPDIAEMEDIIRRRPIGGYMGTAVALVRSQHFPAVIKTPRFEDIIDDLWNPTLVADDGCGPSVSGATISAVVDAPDTQWNDTTMTNLESSNGVTHVANQNQLDLFRDTGPLTFRDETDNSLDDDSVEERLCVVASERIGHDEMQAHDEADDEADEVMTATFIPTVEEDELDDAE